MWHRCILPDDMYEIKMSNVRHREPFQYKGTVLPAYNSHYKDKIVLLYHLIFIMGKPIHGKTIFIEIGSRSHHNNSQPSYGAKWILLVRYWGYKCALNVKIWMCI